LVLGPAIGSLLYRVGGFALPFYFCGVLFLCSSMLLYDALPESVESKDQNDNK